MSTQSPVIAAAKARRLRHPVLSFALANFKGSVKNRIMMAVTLLTPLMLLLMFWLLSRAEQKAADPATSFNIMEFMFPGIIAFTVVQAGGPHATTIVNWREQGIFKRLFCTPVPLWQLVLGRALSQIVLAVVQACLVMAAGVLLLGLRISLNGIGLGLLTLFLGSACFVALGSVFAGISRNATIANSLYVFIIIPLMFLGDSLMPASLMPPALRLVGQFLPTAMVTSLIRPLLTTGVLPDQYMWSIVGLFGYTVAFIALSVKLFRWN